LEARPVFETVELDGGRNRIRHRDNASSRRLSAVHSYTKTSLK
jgi:hypothetical protein